MNELAEKCIQCHKKPLVKLNLQGLKLFIPSKSDEETLRVNKSLDLLREALEAIRVERRCGRSKCVWDSQNCLTQVIKIVGTLQHFGYRNKQGYFMQPNETLFLLEMNRIEILWNSIPMSLQQAYAHMIPNLLSMWNYKVYRKLTHNTGYQLRQLDSPKKRKFLEETDSNPKKPRHESEPKDSAVLQLTVSLQQGSENSNEILRDSSKQIHNSSSAEPDYMVYLPSNKTNNPDFNLYITKIPALDKCLNMEENVPNITAFPYSDTILFYRFSTVSLPVL